MKNIALIATVSLGMFSASVSGQEISQSLFNQEGKEKELISAKRGHHKKYSHKHCKCPRGPTGPNGRGSTGATGPTGPTGTRASAFGSFYYDQSSAPTGTYPQQITIPNGTNTSATGALFFYGIDSSEEVVLSGPNNSVVVPADGKYQVQWNATVSPVGAFDGSVSLQYLFDIQKTSHSTSTILNPTPQQQAHLSAADLSNDYSLIKYLNFGSSLVVPLLANDEISLLFTLNGVGNNIGSEGAAITQAQISVIQLSN